MTDPERELLAAMAELLVHIAKQVRPPLYDHSPFGVCAEKVRRLSESVMDPAPPGDRNCSCRHGYVCAACESRTT